MTKIRSQDQLLDAAEKVFRERGYDAARLEDIATQLGVLQGSLYYHVQSKAALLRMVRRRGFKRLTAVTEQIVTGPEDPKAKLHRATVETWRYLARHPLGDPLGGYRNDLGGTPKEVREDQMNTKAYRDLWKSLLEQGIEAGVVRGDLNLSVTVLSILGAVTWSQNWFHEDGSMSVDELAEAQFELLWAAIAT